MSSGLSGTPQHAFLSTHNALRLGGADDDKIVIHVSELGEGVSDRSCILSLFPFYDVEMVKRLVIKRLELPLSTNISEIRIIFRGNVLPNHRSLLACTTDRDRAKIRLQWAFRDSHGIGIRELGIRSPPQLEATINEINLAFQRGMIPRLTMDGTGGTYIMTSTKRQCIAMFKPSDEEAFAPNNPRGYEGKFGQKGFRSGVLSGEGAQREVAAFLLDAQYGRVAGVPETSKVEACHPSFSYRDKNIPSTWKEGSLQEFVDAHECCGDFDCRVFSIADVHKIGIFDLRILNLDRNDGNLLVGPAEHLKLHHTTSSSFNGANTNNSVDNGDLTPEGRITKYRLIPIDHGLILPDVMDPGDIDLVWYYWPQVKIQFSEAELRHIFSIDADKDALRLARKLEIREDCLRTMRVSTRVLQIGARMHLNLFQIATIALRFDDFEQPSIIERAVKTSLMQAWTAVNAASLIQQNRLPNSMIIDLQVGEMPINQSNTVTSKGPSHGIGSKRVEFAPTLSPRSKHDSNSPVHVPLEASETISNNNRNPDQRQTENLSKKTSSRFPSLILSPNSTRTSTSFSPLLHLPKLISLSSDDTSSWRSWSSSSSSTSSSSSEATSDDNNERLHVRQEVIAVSRISGVPLVGTSNGQTQLLNRSRKKRRKEKEKWKKESINSTSCTDKYRNNTEKIRRPKVDSSSEGSTVRVASHRRPSPDGAQPGDVEVSKVRKHTSHSGDPDLVPSSHHHRTTTVRKRTTALSRRGTSNRVTPANVNSTWTLLNNNRKPILLDWDNPLLEKTFFECFELLIRRHIIETHPDWETYPFNGENVLKEMESALAAASSHRHRRRSGSKRFDSVPTAPFSCTGAALSSSSSASGTAKNRRNVCKS